MHWCTVLCDTAIVSSCINVEDIFSYVLITRYILSEDSDTQPENFFSVVSYIIVEETSVYWYKAAIARDFIRKKVRSTTTVDPVTLTERLSQLANGAVLWIWKSNASIEGCVVDISKYLLVVILNIRKQPSTFELVYINTNFSFLSED